MAIPYDLDLYSESLRTQTGLYHGIELTHLPTLSGDPAFSNSTSSTLPSSARRASIDSRTTSHMRTREDARTGSLSQVFESNNGPPLVYHPKTGVFQAVSDEAATPEIEITKSGKEKPKNKSKSFSSISSSMHRPRGSVFKRALFNAGIPTKESRLLAAAEAGDVEVVSGLLSSGADVNWHNEHGETSLIYAAWAGHEPVVAALLHHPATHANLQDNEGWSALMWASKGGHDGVVRLFLVHPDTEPDLTNTLGETALMRAAVQGHAKVVKLLASSYRTTVDKRHPDGSTALLWAAAGGSVECVNALLHANADIDTCDLDGMDSLMWAVSVGHVEVVELLMQRGCNMTKRDKVGRTPLIMAAEIGHAEVASFLLSHDDIDVNLTTKDRISSLMRAASRGHSPLVNMLVKCKDIDVNQKDSQGRTALIYAARAGQALCVAILLKHPAVLCNVQDSEGYSACIMAASYGHDEALDALLKHDKINVLLRTRHGLTALSMAARAGSKTAVKAILAHPTVNINEIDGQSMTALAWASKQGSVLVVELLQQYQNLKPNTPNIDGVTPLMWAARGNQLLVVQTLIRDPRVDPIATDNLGKTALDWATKNKFEQVVHFLRRYQEMASVAARDDFDNVSLNSSESTERFHPPSMLTRRFEKSFEDANVDSVSDVDRYLENGPFVNWRPKSGKTSFAWAVACGQTDIVKVFLLVPNLDVNEVDSEGMTPLMIAACSGHNHVVRLLLTHEKTDVNRGDPIGRTALMMAATNGHLRTLCNLLCCPHINVNQYDIAGHTALTLAAQMGLYEITRELLRHPDTKANIRTLEGGTPLLYAFQAGHEYVVELLMERPETDVNVINERGEFPLLLAAGHQGSSELTSTLLSHPSINVNLRAPAGHSALLLCARNDYVDCGRLLLDHDKINVNLQDSNGFTSLMFAALLGHEDMVRILFSHPGTDPNLKCKESGNTALILAARNNRTSIIEVMLARRNVDVNITDDFGATALNHCVRRNSRKGVYLLLDREEVDINLADAEGKTPLLRACADGYYDLAMILLAKEDVDVNYQTLEGKTALMYAAQAPEGLAALRLMLAIPAVEVNAKDEDESTALLYGCKCGNTEAVAAILETCSMEPEQAGKQGTPGTAGGRHLLREARDSRGYTPLMWGALLGFVDIVRLLLQVKGLNSNALGPDGLAALGLACECGHVAVVQVLTTHPSVQVNAVEEEGRTALEVALEGHQHECVCILLQHPSHSLFRSRVRPPYLPPPLKQMVDSNRQHEQVRAALVLSCPPPGLVLDGGGSGGRLGGTSEAGGAKVASALLQLPRPFQVVQHVVRRATSITLSSHVAAFTPRIDQSQAAALVFISGEILVTPEGPALSLSPPSPQLPPTHVLLSSLISSLPRSPSLLIVLDVLSLRVTSSLRQAKHVMRQPHAHVLPPLVHPHMAVLAGGGGGPRQVCTGSRSSPFIAAVSRELLHGVTLQQLQQRVHAALKQQAEDKTARDRTGTAVMVHASDGAGAKNDDVSASHSVDGTNGDVSESTGVDGKKDDVPARGGAGERIDDAMHGSGSGSGSAASDRADVIARGTGCGSEVAEARSRSDDASSVVKKEILCSDSADQTEAITEKTAFNERKIKQVKSMDDDKKIFNTHSGDIVKTDDTINGMPPSGYVAVYGDPETEELRESFSSIRAKFDSTLKKLSFRDSLSSDKNSFSSDEEVVTITKRLDMPPLSEELKDSLVQENSRRVRTKSFNNGSDGSPPPTTIPKTFDVTPSIHSWPQRSPFVLFASNMSREWRF